MNIQNFGQDVIVNTEFDLSEIKGRLNSGTNVSEPKETDYGLLSDPMEMGSTKVGQDGKVGNIHYDVPFRAIFDRNRDGSYTAMYKNYQGAEGNEDRLTREQGFWEKTIKGITRFGSKTGLYALDATVGTAAGIINGIQKGELSAVWDNDVSNWLDDADKQLNHKLPIYYTDEYKSQNILENIFYNPMTFITKDLADGMAFVTGALLPEIAIAYLSGGTSLTVSAAKMAARGALGAGKAIAKGEIRAGFKAGVNALTKKEGRDQTMSMVRLKNRTSIASGIGEIGKTAAFIARTSNFEAGMEARHNFHDAVEAFHLKYEEQNGVPPTLDETIEFYNEAREAGNWAYGANMAVLSLSNIAMFGAKFGIATNTRGAINDFGNRFIGLTPKKIAGGRLALAEATKAQKIAGKTYKILSKPLTEGLYEEGFQGVIGKTMQDYMAAKYNPELDETYGLMNSLGHGFAETYGTKEGWKEIGLGMIIGFGAPMLQGGAASGFGKDSYTSARSEVQKQVDQANAGIDGMGGRLAASMNNANTAKVFRDRMLTEQQEASENGTIPPRMDMNNAIIAKGFIESQSHLKPMSDIIADYEAIIEGTELSEEIKEQVQDVAEYKRAMVEEFKTNVANYKTAKTIVNNLGLNRKLKTGLTKGNELEIGDYLITSMMLGQAAQESSVGIGNDIQRMVGKDGIRDAMKFYSDLKEEQKNAVNELDSKRRELEKQKKLFVESGKTLAEFRGTAKELTEGSKEQKRQNQLAEQHEVLRQEVTKLDAEVTQMQETIDQDVKAMNFKLPSEDAGFAADSMMDKLKSLEELDQYIDSLRKNGREADANSLEYMIEQYKEFNDAHREVNNLFSLMGDTNFFTSGKGQSLISSILGPSYEMSEETIAKVRENNEIIDSQLNRFGVRDYETVEQKLKEMLEENEDLSDREKFKLEGLIRMQLTIQSRIAEASADMAQKEQALAQKEVDSNPLTGDSIAVRVRRIAEDKKENTSTRLGKLITEMLAAVDARRATSIRENQPTEIETEVETENSEEVVEQQEINTEIEEQIQEETGETLNETEEGEVYTKDGERGTIRKEGQTFVFETDTRIYELGNIEEVGATSISEFGLEVEKPLDISVDNNYGVTIEGKKYTNKNSDPLKAINENENGEVISVNLTNEKGKKVTIRGQRAQEVAYQYLMLNFEQNATEETIERVNREVDRIEGENEQTKREAEDTGTKERTEVTPVSVKDQVLALLKRDLAEEEASDFKSQEVIDQLKEEIAVLEGKEQEVVVQEEKTAPKEKQPTKVEAAARIIDSEEYARIEELNKKALTEPLTQEEVEELEQLEDDLDRWIAITGMEVEGFRLSDLIKLKNQLDNSEILELEQAENLTPQQKLDGLFQDKKYGPNYDLGQSYGAVTSTGITKGGVKYVSIQGISLEDLNDELPDGFGLVASTEEFPEEVQKGNIVISQEEADRVNLGNTGIMINPPSENLTTNYGVVVKEDASGNLNPLKSSHAKDFAKPMDPNSIYEAEVGDEVTLEIDPKDPHNVELLDNLRRAIDAGQVEAIEEVKKELRKGLVIRTRVRNKFSSVLKGKTEFGQKNLNSDMQFEAMRDELIDNEAFLQELLTNKGVVSNKDGKGKFPVKGVVTVKTILPGQPNFNMRRAADGSAVIEGKPFKESDAKKIVDIGYLEGGKPKTRTGKKLDDTIDTTFIKAFEKSKSKVPFVVIKKGNKRYAYPVTLKSKEKLDNTEFETVFNSNMSDINKVLRLNELLASRGVDIKKNGDNFNTENIGNESFFNDKLAQVESIDYLYDLDGWITGKEKMEDILIEQAMVDINLSEPFHSPKMSFEYKDLKVDTTSYVKAQPAKNEAAKSNGSLVGSSALDKVKKDNSDCKK